MIIAAMLLAVTCDPAMWKHTYRHNRFVVVNTCKSFTGTIDSIRKESDGDLHIRLRLDPDQGAPLNHQNMVRQRGCMVVEPICQRPVTQRSAEGVCNGVTPIPVPRRGSHVRVWGVYLRDNEPRHGWMEIHATTKFEVIP